MRATLRLPVVAAATTGASERDLQASVLEVLGAALGHVAKDTGHIQNIKVVLLVKTPADAVDALHLSVAVLVDDADAHALDSRSRPRGGSRAVRADVGGVAGEGADPELGQFRGVVSGNARQGEVEGDIGLTTAFVFGHCKKEEKEMLSMMLGWIIQVFLSVSLHVSK